MGKIVVVDDDQLVRNLFRRTLEHAGHEVIVAQNVMELLAVAERETVEVVVLDVHLPDGRGDQVVEQLLRRDPLIFVVVVTGDLSIETAVSATRNGAFDYMTKPFRGDALLHVVGNALQARQHAVARLTSERTIRPPHAGKRLLGRSTAIVEVNLLMDRVAKSPNTPVLITGESGTGKEVTAQAIHNLSDRREKPLVRVNCAAIPKHLVESELFGHERGAFTDAKELRKGLFELADGGTIFLDEIGELDIAVQPKLLRVLEDRTITRVGAEKPRAVDLRVIAATNRDLKEMCAERTFREDLYFRLAVLPIELPPLREHPEDIAVLANAFLEEKAAEMGRPPVRLAPELLAFLRSYHWPGNVRELRNMIERLLILSDSNVIQLDERTLRRYCFASPVSVPVREGVAVAPAPDLAAPPPPEGILTLEELERRHIRFALDRLNNNKTHAAQRLGISRSTLQRKIEQYGLEAPEGAPV